MRATSAYHSKNHAGAAWTTAGAESGRALRRLHSGALEPLFVADWEDVVFLHYAVEESRLQKHVPFRLDAFGDGSAYVSFVAFTIRNLRLAYGGRLTSWLTLPIAEHEFLNLRTYVDAGQEPGIFFLCEWLNNRKSLALGKWSFGLPYRWGDLRYRHSSSDATVRGDARGREERLEYHGDIGSAIAPGEEGTLIHFLTERYTAYTKHPLFHGYFRVWHPPWNLREVNMGSVKSGLLCEAPGASDWLGSAHYCGAHFCQGLRGVRMGRPHPLGARRR